MTEKNLATEYKSWLEDPRTQHFLALTARSFSPSSLAAVVTPESSAHYMAFVLGTIAGAHSFAAALQSINQNSLSKRSTDQGRHIIEILKTYGYDHEVATRLAQRAQEDMETVK